VPSKIQHVFRDLHILNVIEIFCLIAHFIGIAQQHAHQALVARFQRNHMLAAREHAKLAIDMLIKSAKSNALRKPAPLKLCMRIMIKRISILFALSCFVTTNCLADEAQEAVALLSDALKCPNPVDSVERDPPRHFTDQTDTIFETTQQINKYAGTTDYLIIDNETRHGDGHVTGYSFTVPYSILLSTTVVEEEGSIRLILKCAPNSECIHMLYKPGSCGSILKICRDDDPNASYEDQDVKFCDAETAGYAKLAIDTLMKQSRRPALKPR
jgi:hypothetical protein